MTIRILPQEKEALKKVCAELGYKLNIMNEDKPDMFANVNIFDPELGYRIGFHVRGEITAQMYKEAESK